MPVVPNLFGQTLLPVEDAATAAVHVTAVALIRLLSANILIRFVIVWN